MKYIATTMMALVGLSLATPIVQKRQNIDFAAYDAIPDLPDVAAPAGDSKPAIVTYAPSAVASAAAQAMTATTGAIAAAVTDVNKRSVNVLARRSSVCSANTPGAGDVVNNPDTAAAFQAFSNFGNNATQAVVPVGYKRVVTNGTGAASDSTYMTYKMMSSYDTAGCMTFCQSQQGCNSFNICRSRTGPLHIYNTLTATTIRL